MKLFSFFTIGAAVALVSCAKAAEEEAVVTLTKDNFEEFIASNPTALIEFYAPWCGHCKNLAPEYEAAAKRLKESGGIPLAKVDATAETELAEQFHVRGYPTLKLFKGGVPTDYTGGRTADLIIQWIETMTGPAAEELSEADAMAKVEAEDRMTIFVARVASKSGPAYEAYAAVADKFRLSCKFLVVVSDGAADEVTAYRPEEEPAKTKIGKEEELDKWVSEERFPFLGPIDGENYGAYEERGLETVWFAGTTEHYKKHAADLREVAKKNRDKLSFVWLDTAKFAMHAEGGLGITEFPGLALRLKDGNRYIMPSKDLKTAAGIGKFIEDAFAGKIEKFLKSEPIPETNDEPVKVVVGKNFEEMVFQKDVDVMIEIYSPSCGHCKRFEPIYTEFAEKVSSVAHLLITKLDGTANEIPSTEFNFRGFPTVFFVKAGETVPQVYNGARTVEALVEFVQKESSKPVEVEGSEEEEDKDEL